MLPVYIHVCVGVGQDVQNLLLWLKDQSSGLESPRSAQATQSWRELPEEDIIPLRNYGPTTIATRTGLSVRTELPYTHQTIIVGVVHGTY